MSRYHNRGWFWGLVIFSPVLVQGKLPPIHLGSTQEIVSREVCAQKAFMDNASDEELLERCEKNQEIRNACGPNGETALNHVLYAQMGKIMEFRNGCSAAKGETIFPDPSKPEPQNPEDCRTTLKISKTLLEDKRCTREAVCSTVVECMDPQDKLNRPEYVPTVHPLEQ